MALSIVMNVTHTHKVFRLPIPGAAFTLHCCMMAQLQVATHVIQISLMRLLEWTQHAGSVRAERTNLVLDLDPDTPGHMNFLSTPGRTARVSNIVPFL